MTLIQKKNRLSLRLRECQNMIRGSLNSVCIKCKRANCICVISGRKLAHRLTYKDREQKTKIVYVSNERVGEIKKMLKAYAKYRDVIQQLVETNIELFRRGEKI